MHRAPSKSVRWVLALLVGVPGTAFYLPLTVLIALSGVQGAIDAFVGGPWNYSPPPELGQGLVYAVWGIGGALGLIGFWLWVFQPKWASRPVVKWFVALLLTAGIASMVPVTAAFLTGELQWSALSLLSVVSILAGLLVLYYQVRSGASAA